MKIGPHGDDIGKYKILLDKVSSTQWFALELLRNGHACHGTMVSCLEQTQGKGRLEKGWDSEKNKNIAVNFILKDFKPVISFTAGLLSMMAALAVCHTAKIFIGSDVYIKWPNDIISRSKKVAGMLITNQWRGTQMESSVIGIGINVNQVNFPGIPQAGSIKSITGSDTDINAVIQTLIKQLNYWYSILCQNAGGIVEAYHLNLYGYQQWIKIKTNQEDVLHDAKILEVDQDGKVKLEFKNGLISSYDLDELKIIF